MEDNDNTISLDDWEAAMQEQTAPRSSESMEKNVYADKVADVQPGSLASIFESFDKAPASSVQTKNDIELIMDIPVALTVELGRTRIAVRNLLQLAQGSVVELDGLAGEPLDVLANGTLIAQGEVVVVNDKFGIRLTDVVTPMERLKRMRR